KLLDQFTIKLAPEKPDYWVFFDAAPYQGKILTLEISKFDPPSFGGMAQPAVNTQTDTKFDTRGLKMIFADSKFPGEDSVYKESRRPQVHFSSRRGWINDPNGLLYANGEYHLYYQHNPYGWAWGNMHWGHAVSKDLVHWKEGPIALYPPRHGDWCFSGSAVVDKANTAGWKKGVADVLVAAFTSTGRGECVVYSTDRGRSWTEFAGNPVVKHAGRDPKLIWHEPTKKWVMAVYDE